MTSTLAFRLATFVVLSSSIAIGATGPVPEKSELIGGASGILHAVTGQTKLCGFMPLIADSAWASHFAATAKAPTEGSFGFKIMIGNQPVNGELAVSGKDGAVDAVWTFSAPEPVSFQTLAIASEFNLDLLAGGTWETDSTSGTFPEVFGASRLFSGPVSSLSLTFTDGRKLKFAFPTPVFVLLQDNRQWDRALFTVRIGRGAGKMAAGEKFQVKTSITMTDGMEYRRDLPEFLKPVVLKADQNWVPLRHELDIVPGSALDMSVFGFTDGPCGSKGRVIVTPEGHFALSGNPGKASRFYGVNLCYRTQDLTKERIDQLLDRLVRLGYNSVRIHHIESELTTPRAQAGFEWDPAKVDLLDYLMAGCAKRGLWLALDLHMDRPISGKQLGLPEAMVSRDKYHLLLPIYEPAFQDWALFSRKFLDRINPYTGKRVVEDPTVAWLAVVNEGPLSGHWSKLREMPEWTAAWNKWLRARYSSRAELLKVADDLAEKEDAALNTVQFPATLAGDTARSRLAQVFIAGMEKSMFERMRHFLRTELKCQALLSNMNNAGAMVVPLDLARADYDYVDEHFYVDHPAFLEKPWQAPSTSRNTNPVKDGAPGGTGSASVRLWGKPFVSTEFEYCAPSPYRAVGSLLTGGLASLQDWDAVWRFTYSHGGINMFESRSMYYFDLATDPLNQAADRMTLLLYARRDLQPAPHRVATIIPRSLLSNPPSQLRLSGLQSLAWITQIGSLLVNGPEDSTSGFVALPIEASANKAELSKVLATAKLPPVPGRNDAIRSETGELVIVPNEGVLTVDTAKSAGGYADPGKAIEASKAGVKIDGVTTAATVLVSSLDANPIKTSKRLLVTHLTDLQNTGVRFADASRQTVLDWGATPHLVRDGTAILHLKLAKPETYTVWALATSGRRVEKMEAKVQGGELVFTASVRGSEGARMLYEVTNESPKAENKSY